MNYFKVVSVISYCEIFDVGSTTGEYIRKPMYSRITGEFSALFLKNSSWLDVEPFDVRLYSYDPISDKAYVAKILNILPCSEDINEHKISFQAKTLLQWKEITQKD